jgi:hypothetical protein
MLGITQGERILGASGFQYPPMGKFRTHQRYDSLSDSGMIVDDQEGNGGMGSHAAWNFIAMNQDATDSNLPRQARLSGVLNARYCSDVRPC